MSIRDRLAILRAKLRLFWLRASNSTKVITIMVGVLLGLAIAYFLYQYWLAVLFLVVVGGISYTIVKKRIDFKKATKNNAIIGQVVEKPREVYHNETGYTELIYERNGYRVYMYPNGGCCVHKSGQCVIDNLLPEAAIDYVERISPSRVVYQREQTPPKRNRTPIDPEVNRNMSQRLFSTDMLRKMVDKK